MQPSTQTVTLVGPALRGVGPSPRGALDVPQAVRLGRVRPAARPMAPRLRAYLRGAPVTPPPASTTRRDHAAASLARMYLNDRLGCCVIAGKGHALGVWGANDSDSPGEVVASDAEIQAQYRAICGPGDRGCVMTDVLDVMRSRGLVAGRKPYKIDGYVSVDHANKLEVQVALYLFGCLDLGINLPEEWTSAAVWDVTPSAVVGGHCVLACDYDEKGVYVVSWGRLYLLTWPAFADPRWLEECYALLAPLWYGDDRLAPSGVDAQALRSDLDALGRGELPPLPLPPSPPAPAGDVAELVALDPHGKEIARYRKE